MTEMKKSALVLFLLACTSAAGADSWPDYREDATEGFRYLREVSQSLSFKSSRWSTQDGKRELKRTKFVNQNGHSRCIDQISPRWQRLAMVTGEFGLLLERQSQDDKWTTHRYGPNRKAVYDTGRDEFMAVECPPLTPGEHPAFDELLKIDGTVVSDVEATENEGEPRVRATLTFKDNKLSIRGQDFRVEYITYEFAPRKHWVVTGFEMVQPHVSTVEDISYSYDHDGRPLLEKVVVDNHWTKSGVRQTVETIYENYSYNADELVFDPATYGLPPLKAPASDSNWRWLWVVSGVILVGAGFGLRRRAQNS